ncbi:MAG: hypothetical protein F4X98_12705 [Gammaproteobacteria bacterium]|nr:hypothetical protein [Gammaproteobacteria bacterium]
MKGEGRVEARVLFETPQSEIASLIRSRLERCESASLVAGFVTVDGIDAMSDPLVARPDRLELLLIGAGTHKAFQACDRLIEAGVENERLQVHLGFTRRAGRGFARYHPMLHSKVYLMEMTGGGACAFIGSHNLTHFAMRGLNGEASVLLEGPSSADEFEAVRAHIGEAAKQAVEYDPAMKDAYNWWAVEFLGGLKSHVDDRPKDDLGAPTIVVLAASTESELPGLGEVIYFEIPDAIRAMRREVHVFLFDILPASPTGVLDAAKCMFRGVVVGLEDRRGGVELLADWEVETGRGTSKLVRTDGRVRPRPRDGVQQVRVEIQDVLDEEFLYLPVPPRTSWVPVLDEMDAIDATGSPDSFQQADAFQTAVRTESWYRVIGLDEAGGRKASAYRRALVEMSPEAGGYTLMLRRVRSVDDESGPEIRDQSV